MQSQGIGPDHHLKIDLWLFVDRDTLHITRNSMPLNWLWTTLFILFKQFNLIQSYDILNQLFVVFFFWILTAFDAKFSDFLGAHNIVVNFPPEILDEIRAVLEVLLQLHEIIIILNV